MEIGENIRRIRKIQKMTQAELAKKTGISLATIRRYENGDYSPNLERIKIIADALGVPNHEIIGLQTFETGEEFTRAWNTIVSTSTTEEQNRTRMNEAFDKMNAQGQKAAAERVEELAQIPAYQKEND